MSESTPPQPSTPETSAPHASARHSTRHPATRTWSLPPERAALGEGLARTNLLALCARPGRFEHHLLVVGRVGEAQIEVATASEPLSFAHVNLSDEYVVALPTGDALIDSFPFRVFLSDADSGQDVARIKHRVGELIVHPDGFSHWPGRLRPPFAPPAFPGPRRAVLSAVVCAAARLPAGERPLFVSGARAAEAKAYVEPAPPMLLADSKERGLVGRLGDVRITQAAPPYAPARGGLALVLEVTGESDAAPGDLVRIEPGLSYEGAGVVRALLVESSSAAPEPPPRVWDRVPEEPFAVYEDAPPGALPFVERGLRIEAVDDAQVRVTLGEDSSPGSGAVAPRHWLARMLYRIALHTFVVDGVRVDSPLGALGRVSTYGGVGYRDQAGRALFLADGGEWPIADDELVGLLERMYRAVAPPGYTERLE